MRSLEAKILSSSNPSQVSAFYVSTIRTFVKLGFGVGIVPRRPEYPSDPELHERSLSKHAGRTAIFAVTPRGANFTLAAEFVDIMRKVL